MTVNKNKKPKEKTRHEKINNFVLKKSTKYFSFPNIYCVSVIVTISFKLVTYFVITVEFLFYLAGIKISISYFFMLFYAYLQKNSTWSVCLS